MRYFKATDGIVTVFRASNTAYRSAGWITRQDDAGVGVAALGFSRAAGRPGTHPVEEIVQSEYEALKALKMQRVSAFGGDPKRYSSPQDSWVRNTQLHDD